MLSRLIRFSLSNAMVVVLAALALVATALYRLPRTAVDVFPELSAPTVTVLTEAPGLASEEVEQYVTLPVEVALNGVPGVRLVRSSSAIGLSLVRAEFEWDTDVYRARQLVTERLVGVREQLPAGAHAELTPITSITGEILLLAVSSPDGSQSQMSLRSFAEFELRNRLLAVPGVAQVSVIGGELAEYQVLIDQDRLRLYGLSPADVARAAGEAHSSAGAGYLPDVDHLELPIRQSGRVRSVEDIAGTLVKLHEGAVVTLGDVADVRLGPAPRRGTGADGGRTAVVLTVQKAPGTNTLEVTEQVDEVLAGVRPALPAGLEINSQVFRQSDFIQLSVHNVVKALRDAAIVVSIILLLFLLDLRSTLVTLTALPLSLAAGLLVLEQLGETINVMTLGGLAIAVGSLVDDAIIDVENVLRRLAQNARLPAPERLSRREVVYRASNEIRPAMVFATAIIALVFLPLMFLEGLEGRFFRPLGIAFVVSLGASLLVALTVTPALCGLLFREPPQASEASEATAAPRPGPLTRVLAAAYRPCLRLALRWRRAVMAAALAATLAALALASTFGTSFLPDFNEGTFTVGLFAPPGSSLDSSDRMARAIEQRLLRVDGVRSVTRRTGRAERDEHAEPVSNSELEITVRPGSEKDQVRARLREILESVPGLVFDMGQPIQHRLSHMLSGTPAAIAISIYGEDLDRLRALAAEVEHALEELPGAVDVNANRELRVASIPVTYRPALLAAYGLTPRAAAEQVRAACFGETVAQVHDGPRRIDLTVRVDPEALDSLADLGAVQLHGSGGARVRLDEVADIEQQLATYQITRENSQRKAVVSLNVGPETNLGHLVEAVRGRTDAIVQRAGYRVSYGGQFESSQAATRRILLLGAGVLVGMLVLLQLATGSIGVALLVLLNLPLALIGGVLAVYLAEVDAPFANLAALVRGAESTAPVLSIAGLVGFITLFGIAVRNGILLVNHYRHLIEEEGAAPFDALLRGSEERLVPILMTALTAALALIPIVLEGDAPGNEILAPLSVVILGGLSSSTLLNLVVVPAGYAWLRGIRPGDQE